MDKDLVTTSVGNALTALDDPLGIPDMDNSTLIQQRVKYAIENLCVALRELEPETYN